MLTRANRLVSSATFARAVRRGRRAGTGTLVLHFLEDGAPGHADRPQVGFVVSKAVGSAVRRNLVQRRLRHLARERLSSFPGSAVLVVRALPAAAAADYRDLATDFDRALARVLRRREGDGARP